VDVFDGTVSVAGAAAPFAWDRPEADAVGIVSDGRRRTVFVAADRDRRWAFVDGAVFEVDVAPAGARRRLGSRHHHESLSAPMPATVVKVAVAPGVAVARDDIVLILEAMKMELPIRAPRAGVVEAIHCREGDLVQPGVPLLDLDEPDAE
jgi:biotin carboxyl carrier protein